MFFKVLILTIVLLTVITRSYGKTQIKIGAIFHADINYQTEIAFLGAINKINKKERTMEIIPVIRHIPPDNSYKAQQAACELTSAGVAAIFGPFSEQTIGIVSRIAGTLKIPHIICMWQPEPFENVEKDDSMTINIFPDGNLLAKALSDLVTDNDWSGYTVIYETPESLMRLKEVLQLHEPSDKPVTVRKLGTDADIRPLLKQIKLTAGDILVDCELNRTLDILEQAKSIDMVGEYQRYLFTSIDTASLNLAPLKLQRANVSTMRLIDTKSEAVENAVVFWNLEHQKRCHDCKEFNYLHVQTAPLLIYEAMTALGTLLAELELYEPLTVPELNCYYDQFWERGENLLNEFTSESLPKVGELTGPLLFSADKTRTNFNLDIVEYGHSGFSSIGKWSSVEGINSSRSSFDIEKQAREDLSTKTVEVVSKYGDPFLMLKKDEDGKTYDGNDRFEGYVVDLLDEISKILNFSYRIDVVPDGKYGNYDPSTKEWNGVVRHIMDRKADIGVCDLTVTYERRTAVDFTMPFMTLGISILYSKPVPVPKNFFSFILPFSEKVWIYSGTAYFLVSMLIFVLSRMAPDEWVSAVKDGEERENIWNLINSTWVTVGSIMQQGSDILPKAGATRIICALWWFFALIMISSYTANMAAFLTNERMDNAISSAEDLAQQSLVKYGAVLGGSTHKFFENSNHSLYKKMYTTMEQTLPSVFTMDNEQGSDRVARSKKKYAFFMESSVLDYIIERKCNLTKLGPPLDSKGYGIAMPHNSKYRKPLNAAILHMQEHGILSKLKTKWWKGGGTCNTDAKVKPEMPELGVANVGGVFVVLIGGCLAGLLIGIMEFLWSVNLISLDEKISLREAFCREFMFAIRIDKTTKTVKKPKKSEDGSVESMNKINVSQSISVEL